MMKPAEPATVDASQRREAAPSDRVAGLQGSAIHAVRAGRPEAAAAIWSWHEGALGDAATRNARVKTSTIRLRGAFKALIPAAIGSVIYVCVSALGGSVVLSMATLIFVAAVLSPTGLYAVIERGLNAATTSVGRLMSWIVLPALFYAVFVPFGKARRGGARDRLQRSCDATRTSYWSDRTGERAASANRRKQY
jgi:hypothetical protein